ncbi:MAG: O-antigen ligase family protein, partial [Candidatus Thorarchaeota archaeon]
NKIKYKGIEIFIFAIILLIIWVVVSLIKNQILAQNVAGTQTGVKRTYFNIFNNILIFFTTIIFFSTQYYKISVEKLIKTILYVTVVIGFVRIFTYHFGLPTPLLTGFFAYNTGTMQMGGGEIAQRFAGLDYATAIGLPALFALYIYKNKLNFFILITFLIFLFLSGGRTTMIGATVAVIVFSILFLPKNLIYLIVAAGIFFTIAMIILPQGFLEGQATRLSTLHQSGFMGVDVWRGTAWYMFLKSFLANPIFGKGIGDYYGFIYSPVPLTEQFARAQLFSGGHGCYFSLLGIFGLGGIIYFLIMVFGGIILSFRKIKEYLDIDRDKTAIAIFCFIQLAILSFVFITGYNGTANVTFLFYLVGLICSIRVMENNPRFNQGENEEYRLSFNQREVE